MDADLAVRFSIGLVMLIGASWSDLRTRRVPNLYWFPFVAAAAVLALGDFVRERPQDLLLPYGVATALCALFYGLWHLRLFGGADAKGLMVLAVLLPWPSNTAVPLPLALDALANGSLLMLGLPLAFAVVNAARGQLVFPAMFLGQPTGMDRAEARFVWPLQRVRDDGTLAWRYLHSPGEELAPTYAALRTAGITRVWVTPKIPFMLPLAVGLAVAGPWGNLVLRLVEPYFA